MRSDPQFAGLIAEFPELNSDNVTLVKELYAHFGLLFYAFALVEHALINFLVFDAVGRGLEEGILRSQQQWEAAFDGAYERAKSQSLGNLIKLVKGIPEIEPKIAELSKMKAERDYFAHHFFREEAAYFTSDEACWLLLAKLREVRLRTDALEQKLNPLLEVMRERYQLPRPPADHLEAIAKDFETRAHIAALEGTVKFGWES